MAGQRRVSHTHTHFSLQSLDQEIAAPASLPSTSEEANLSIGFTNLDGTFTFGPFGNVTLGVGPLRDVCCKIDVFATAGLNHFCGKLSYL